MDYDTLVKMGERSPYFRHLDMALIEAREGHAAMSMAIGPNHRNVEGVVHGGAIASLADQAAMRAVQTLLSRRRVSRTIQMDIHYVAPARGARLTGEARVLKMGRRLAFSDAEVRDEDGTVVALARCTIAFPDERQGPDQKA